jgi:UrcA family protein
MVAAALAAPTVHAQGTYDSDGYYSHSDRDYANSTDEVIVRGRHHHRYQERSYTGAPIDTVSLSRVVYFDDLDLTTRWGARRLEQRVSQAASSACDQLDVDYPISAEDSPPCYQTAMHDGMRQAHRAIAQARGD